ncbi:MAG: universal stress protein [Gammaproteobacteria bacterium]
MKNFKRLLCVVNPEQNYQSAVERAVVLAENNQAHLKVVATMERNGALVRLAQRDIDQSHTDLVNARLHRLETSLAPYRQRTEIQTEILVGIPFLEVIREVLRNNHDLVIKMPENPGLLRSIFGSDDMHLLRKCPCAVWMLKPESPASYQRILAAVDVGGTYAAEEMQTRLALNQKVLETAASLAISDFAELHVVTVWDADAVRSLYGTLTGNPQQTIDAYVAELRDEHEEALEALMHEVVGNLGTEVMDYLKPVRHVVNGSPRREIPTLAKQTQADVVVMGTVARTGIPGFIMGNTAETILNQIDCSVLAIKPPGFASPVTLDA